METHVTAHDTGIIESIEPGDPSPRIRLYTGSARAYLAAKAKSVHDYSFSSSAITPGFLLMMGALALVGAALYLVGSLLFSLLDPFGPRPFSIPKPEPLWSLLGIAALLFLSAGALVLFGTSMESAGNSDERKLRHEFGQTKAYRLELPAGSGISPAKALPVASLAMERLTPEVRDRLCELDQKCRYPVVQEALNVLMREGAVLFVARQANERRAEAERAATDQEQVSRAARLALGLSDAD